MKAPAKSGKKTAKAKTAKTAKPKHYTAAQNASFNAWVKTHPFRKTASSSAHAKHMAHVAHVAHVRRTLPLNGRHEGNEVQLGRNRPYTEDEKPRLVLDRYLPAFGAEPAVVDFASEVLSWPMYGNDTIGDCDPAMHAHAVQAWTRYTGTEADIPQESVIQLYSAVSGYDPNQVQPDGSNPTDTGCVMQDVLGYLRKNGFPGSGHKILAFAQLQDLSKVKQALYVFGSVLLGVNVPQSAMDQFDADQPWDAVQGSPVVGGHAVPLQYAGTGLVPYEVPTWARLQGMTQAFMDEYVEEAWVVITDDWLDKNGHTPEGLDLQQLGADLAAMTGDPNPFPAPPAPVPAPPAPPAPVPPAPAPSPDPSILQEIEQEAKQIIEDIEKVL